jgi:hypothetical protein
MHCGKSHHRSLGVIIVLGYFLIAHTAVINPQSVQSASYADLAASSNYKVFLPIAQKSCPGKCWSGVHMGNRNSSDWNATLLNRIDPQRGGKWPAAAVVLSHQLYNIHRNPSNHPTDPCRIVSASVRSPVLYDYVKRASQSGVRVVIRLWPSPGNFLDWNDPNMPNHRLIPAPPVGPDGYCGPDQYRSFNDLGDEMGRIQALNWSNGFLVFGFAPANEPNIEWYSQDIGTPRIWNSTAWNEMDVYFSAIHDYVHQYYPAYIRVLTPPMAQSRYAEGNDIEDVGGSNPCQDVWLVDGIHKGYDLMRNTYETKSDGVTWHNYWNQGKEAYNNCPHGQHVSIHFPWWLHNAIRNQAKPVVIMEADLGSPWQMRGLNPLPNKRTNNNPTLAANSIRHFFDSEHWFGGQYYYGIFPTVASWLLADDTGNQEHNWHKAYEEAGLLHPWFSNWYSGQE